jgi:hypothetical protein
VHRLELALVTDDGRLIVWPEDCTLGDMDMRGNHHKVFINTLATSAQDLRQTCRQASHAAYAAQAPNGTDHVRIARDLLSDNSVPDDEMRLGSMNRVKENKLARTLKKYTERPECICFHCGTAMYPSTKSTGRASTSSRPSEASTTSPSSTASPAPRPRGRARRSTTGRISKSTRASAAPR